MFNVVDPVPGFGSIKTAYIISMVMGIDRSENEKSFVAYLGIVPAQRDSGDSSSHCSITGGGDETARNMLLQSTFVTYGTIRDVHFR